MSNILVFYFIGMLFTIFILATIEIMLPEEEHLFIGPEGKILIAILLLIWPFTVGAVFLCAAMELLGIEL